MNVIPVIRFVERLVAGTLLLSAAAAGELTLYAEGEFQGRALSIVIDERQLGVRNFDDRTSSVVIENGAWVLCSDEDYGGKCVTLEPGRYASLQALGLNDAITSARRRDPASIGVFSEPREDPDIVLYAGNDFRNPFQSIDKAQANLRTLPMKDEALSVIIASGEWELCDGPQFRAPCVILGPGKYPSLEKQGLEIGAASVRRVAVASHQEEDPPEN